MLFNNNTYSIHGSVARFCRVSKYRFWNIIDQCECADSNRDDIDN